MSNRTTAIVAIALSPIAVLASSIVLASAGLTSLMVLVMGVALFIVDGAATCDAAYLDRADRAEAAPVAAKVDAVPVPVPVLPLLVSPATAVDAVARSVPRADLVALLDAIAQLDAMAVRADASRHRTRAATYRARRDVAWSEYRASLARDPSVRRGARIA